MLGEHFVGDSKTPLCVYLAARDDALPLAKQVRQDAGIVRR